jgi:hypothetical protein
MTIIPRSGSVGGGDSRENVFVPSALTRAAVQEAADLAIAASGVLELVPGETYSLAAGYIDLNNAIITVRGTGATIVFPSDDATVVADAIATTDEQARSAFLIRGTSTVHFEGIKGQGGTERNLSTVQLGRLFYNKTGTDCRWISCSLVDGAAMWAEDATATGSRAALCSSTGARAPDRWGTNGQAVSCWNDLPIDHDDILGQGHAITQSGTTSTLSCRAGRFPTDAVGLPIKVYSSTTADNDVWSTITVRTDANTISYENAAGVAELHPGHWWIPRGDTFVGFGFGTAGIAVSGTTVTVKTAVAHGMTSADVGMCARLIDATTEANNGIAAITSVPTSTTFTFEKASCVSEDFSGVITVDSYDRVDSYDGTIVWGSTHAWYAHGGLATDGGGRRDWELIDCSATGRRGAFVKASSTAQSLHRIRMINCTARLCAAYGLLGADDAQEHIGIEARGAVMIDCGTGRPGWSYSNAVEIVGSNGTYFEGAAHYTRNCVNRALAGYTAGTLTSFADGSSAGIYCVKATRYYPGGVDGLSQPLENLTINVRITTDPDQTTSGRIGNIAAHAQDVGITAKWAESGVTLTKSVDGVTMTCSHSAALLNQNDVGALVSFSFPANAENDVNDKVIQSVASNGRSFTFTNALGVDAAGVGGGGASVDGGTYRIRRKNAGGGFCRIKVDDGGAFAITVNTVSCVGPEIDATWNLLGSVIHDGCLAPYSECREILSGSNNAKVIFKVGTSWPFAVARYSVGANVGGDTAPVTLQRGIGIGIDATVVDYPLNGDSPRCVATGGIPQILIPYGSKFVNGDRIGVGGTTLTFKRTGAGAGQFDRYSGAATGFLERVAAIGGYDAQDYGSQFSPTISTYHLLIQATAATDDVNAIYVDTHNVLNPTALPILRNAVGGGEAICYSEGEQTAGVAVRTVAWGPWASTYRGGSLIAANATAAAVLANAAGVYVETKTRNHGVCAVFVHAAATSASEFRAKL